MALGDTRAHGMIFGMASYLNLVLLFQSVVERICLTLCEPVLLNMLHIISPPLRDTLLRHCQHDEDG